MNVLVTGSTGFIGGALCRALVAQGHTVRAFHRSTSSLSLLEGLPVEHATGDLTQPATLEAAMQGIEVVFHTAAMLGHMHDPGRMYAITVEGTRFVLQAALKARVRRVVHTSSVAALGVPERGPGGIPADPPLLDEAHSWNYIPGRWPYGYAKNLAEQEVQKAVAQGLDVVIVNPAVVIGPGDIYRLSDSIVVNVARRRFPVAAQGGMNVVHIDDVVAGHLAALERSRTGERTILGGENISLLAFLALTASVTGAPPPRGVLPMWVIRPLAWAARLASTFINLPVDTSLLNLAGYYFYYDLTKSQRDLGLPAPRPARMAVEDAWAWFKPRL
jgi:dihydroflavonol-4-reductase